MSSNSILSVFAGILSILFLATTASANATFTVQIATAQGDVNVTGNHTSLPLGSNSASAAFTFPSQNFAVASAVVPNSFSDPVKGWSAASFTSVNLPGADTASLLPPIGQPTSSVYVQMGTSQFSALGIATSGSISGQITATSFLVLDAPSRWKFTVDFSNTGSSSTSLHSMEITGPNGFDVLYSGGLLDQNEMFDLLPGNYTITGSQDVAFTATSLAFSAPNVTPCFDESMFNASWVSDVPEPASLALLVAGAMTSLPRRRRACSAQPPC